MTHSGDSNLKTTESNVNTKEDREILDFLIAAQSGDTVKVKNHLRHGMPVDVECLMYEESALVKACRMGEVETAQLLLLHGADVNKKTGGDCYSPLHIAVNNNQLEAVKFLLSCRANPNARDCHQKTPLMLAASKMDIEAARLLIAAGCDVDSQDDQGMCALHLCFTPYHGTLNLTSKSVDFVKVLAEAGADLDVMTMHGRTPLGLAVHLGHTRGVKCLLMENCDPDIPCALTPSALEDWVQESMDIRGRHVPPLMLAIRSRNARLLKILVFAGCNYHCYSRFMPFIENTSPEMHALLADLMSYPRTLKDLGKLVVRRCLRGKCKGDFRMIVNNLGIPQSLQDYILLTGIEEM